MSIDEQVANIRYHMREAHTQTDRVHELTVASQLDEETIMLNLKDLQDQLKVVQGELQEAIVCIQGDLDASDRQDNGRSID